MGLVVFLFFAALAFAALRALGQKAGRHMRAASLRHDAAVAAASRLLAAGAVRMPTWNRLPERRAMFLDALRKALQDRGHPAERLDKALADPAFVNSGLTLADALEARGFGFFAQVPATTDFLDDLLGRAARQGLAA
jgi:hypothetical protein